MIETSRLILQQWEERDREPWIAMNADPRVMEFFPGVYSRERSEEVLQAMQRGLEARGYGWWAVEIRQTGEFAGMIAVDDVRYDVPFTPKREVGWRFAFAHWGNGYATEGAAAALEFARERLEWDSVVAFTAARNVRSQRVMQRLAMTHDAREDFDHPSIEAGHPLQRHVLYRKKLL